MKTSAANLSIQKSIVADHFINFKINEPIMKKLANTSPFLLLLLPVFMMIILTLTVSTNQNDAEIVVKPTKAPVSMVKQVSAVFK